MRTNGLVWAVALSLSLAGRVGAAESATDGASPEAIAPACGDQNCQSCCESDVACCCEPCFHDFWYAGAELTMLHVDARPGASNTVTIDDPAVPGTDFAFSQSGDFDNWGYAPRAWIGAHLNENWSFEARYWHLRDFENQTPVATALGAPVGFFLADTTIEAYTVDLDLIRTFNLNGWTIDARLGARHGSFSSVNDVAGSGGPLISLTEKETASFNGTGFSYGGGIKHSLGCSNLFWVTSARGSYMSGNERFDLPGVFHINGYTVTGATPPAEQAELMIGEFQTGLEWDYALSCIPANAFVRASYEFQDWHVNGPSLSFSSPAIVNTQNVDPTVREGLGGLTLQGITLAAGIDW